MENQIALPNNLLSVTNVSRRWHCVDVVVTEFTGAGQVLHRLARNDESRLGVIVEEVGEARCEPRLRANLPCAVDYKPRQLHFTPAGMELWGYSDDVRYVKDVNLCFDLEALARHCELDMRGDLANTPRLRFVDDGLGTLIKMLADAVPDTDPSAQLYGDALITAIAVRLFRGAGAGGKVPTKLSALQLRDALGFLDANLPGRVDLATLASLAGLSPSHYSRAFKASTGLAPYQWQLEARIARAKGLLMDTHGSLEDVAEATGFADAVHFGRTFRKLTGATPAAWQRDRLT